ncbi:MAG: secretin N-terminal domain-containing protein [bacterium]
MKRIIQFLTIAAIMINICLAGTISKVEIKEIDGMVKITINTSAPYKAFYQEKNLRVVLRNTDINLSSTEAELMPGGPVSKVAVNKENENAVLDINLSYGPIVYKVYTIVGLTVVEIKEKDLPEPVGPKTAYSEAKGSIRNYIVLSAPEETKPSEKATEKVVEKQVPQKQTEEKQADKKTKDQVEVKKVEVKKEKTIADILKEMKKRKKEQAKQKEEKKVEQKVQKEHEKPAYTPRRTITLDLVDATLVDTVRLITENLGWNVIFAPEVIKYQEKLTMKLVNVDPEKTLKMILLSNGFDYRIVNDIAYVATPDKLEKFQQDIKAAGPTKSQVINLENASAKEIEPIIKSNFPEANVQVVEKTNSLLVKAPVQTIVEIKNLISQLDVPPPPPPPVTPPVTEVIRLNYAQAQNVVEMMGNLVPKESIAIDQRMNSLIITATPDIIETVKSFVKAVDVPLPQVALRMHFLSLTEEASRQLGVDWGNQANNISIKEVNESLSGTKGNNVDTPYWGVNWFTRNSLTFQATLNYLIQTNKGKVLSAPYVMTQNRQQAEIQIGQQIPVLYTDYRTGQIQAQYINVGIILRVTPDISPDGYVTLNLSPEVSELGAQIQGTQYFIISTNRVQNTVRIKQGDTVLIGGLFRNISNDSIKKVPLLSDIPVIGEIFKARSKRNEKAELIIAITPIVLMDLPKLNETMQYEKMDKKGIKVEGATKF